jgi:hypothetical protein
MQAYNSVTDILRDAKGTVKRESRIRNSLEALVDAESLANVVHYLAEICYLKEQHVAEAWQDDPLARRWGRAGNALEAFRDHHLKSI